MKLDRNISENEGRGKYALIKIRQVELCRQPGPFGGYGVIGSALAMLQAEGILDLGEQGTESEFFVIRLRDKYAGAALTAYAGAAAKDDPEYGRAVGELALRAGPRSPFCKEPD